MLTGTLVNTATVIAGSLIGMLLGNILPERLRDTVMKGLGLCTIFIGITGMFGSENALITIISITVGAIIGELLDLDGHLTRFANWLENRFRKNKTGGKATIAEGFITASLVFCVGAMTIVGSLNAGLGGDQHMLYTKSLLDLVSSCMIAVSLGVGVLFSSAFVFVFQGSIVLLAQLLAPALTESAISEMTCAGSLIILALGLNMIGLSKFKVANFLPAIILAPVFSWLFSLLPISL